MESVESVKPQGEWNRKDKLNFLKVQRILSSVGVFLSIILATNLFLINAQNSNPITKWFGIISALLGVFSVVSLLWSIKQSSVIEQSPDSYASETDNNFSRAILIAQINLLQFFALYFLLFNFAQGDLLNSFPDRKKNELAFNAYRQTIDDKSTWINLLSLIGLAISAFTLFTASALANSTSTHRIAVYVFGLILLVVSFYELQQVRAVADAFSGISFSSFETWSQIALRYRGILAFVFLAGIYLANARRNRLAYLITGVFFLIVIGVTIGSTGQVFRDYKGVQAHFDNNCVLELGTLSAEVIDKTSCGSKYIKKTDLKPENVCPANTNTDPSQCYQGVGSCEASTLQQIWEPTIIENPKTTQFLACVDQRCCGDLNNYYSRFVLLQAAYAFAFVFYAFVLGSFAFQLSSKDKGDNLPRNRQLIFFVTFAALFLLFVILLFLPYTTQVPKNPNNLTSSTQALIQETSFDKQLKFLQQQQFETSHFARQESYGQGGCTQFKSLFTPVSFQKVQKITKAGTPAPEEKDKKVDFNTLLNFESLLSAEDSAACDTDNCGYIYLLELVQTSTTADFQFWSKERSDSYRIIDSESVKELIDPSSTGANNRFFGVVGFSGAIDNILQGERNSLFVCNSQDVSKITLNVRILKTNVKQILSLSTGAAGTTGRVLKMHKSHLTGTTTTTSSTTTSSTTTSSTTTNGGSASSTTKATALPAVADVKFQPIRISVYDLEDGSAIKNAKVSVWVAKTEGATVAHQAFLDTCDLSSIAAVETSFDAITGKDGQAEFLFHYPQNTVAATQQKWAIYVYAQVPGNSHTVNCRRFSIPSLEKLTQNVEFDITLGRSLTGTSTRVLLEWDRLLIDQTKWQTTSNLNLFVTFQPDADSAENFSCHVGFTQTNCKNVRFNTPATSNSLSSQSIDLKSIGNYNYVVYVQRFANVATPTDVSTWFVSDIQAAKATLKYFAAASQQPLVVSELLPATRGYAAAKILSTKAAALQWCIRGKTSIKVQPINTELTTKAPFGIWGEPKWSDGINSFPSTSSVFPPSVSIC